MSVDLIDCAIKIVNKMYAIRRHTTDPTILRELNDAIALMCEFIGDLVRADNAGRE